MPHPIRATARSILAFVCLLGAPAGVPAAPSSASDGGLREYELWRAARLPASPPPPAADPATRRGRAFVPPPCDTVEQIVVTSDALAESFRSYAENETRRGVPTELRTVSWIESRYEGVDRPARIRAFLRDAWDRRGTRYALLGGDTEHVPVRYVPWNDKSIPTDLYYQCLDREWNEDGDALWGEALENATLTDWVNDVTFDASGALWVATNVGVARFADGRFTPYDTARGIPASEVLVVEAAADGSVWIGTSGGAAVWDGTAWTSWTTANGLPGEEVVSVLALSASEAWLGTSGGLVHVDAGAREIWRASDGLPADLVTAIARRGDEIWVGTFRGVARLSSDALEVLNVRNSGLLSNWVLSIEVDAAGTVWFGHEDNTIVDGGISAFGAAGWVVDPLVALGSPAVREIGFRDDELWAATAAGVLRRDDGGDAQLDDVDGLATGDPLGLAVGTEIAIGGPGGLSVGKGNAAAGWMTYRREQGLPSAEVVWDEIDLLPELAVGRVPARDPAQVGVYLDKLHAYRHGVGTDRVDRALFLGEMLFASGDGKAYCVEAREVMPREWKKVELYESEGTQTVASCLAEMSEGPGVVVQVGHGSYDVLGAGPASELLFNSHLDGVDSNGRACLYVVYSCNSGGFDQDCSMEHALFNPNGGAIATIANTRTAVAGLDSDFNREFFARLFDSPHARPAEIDVETRTAIVESDPDLFRLSDWPRRMVLTRSYLGAPTLSLWRSPPRPLHVTHPESVPAGGGPFSLKVADLAGGGPLGDALVCVSQKGERYAVGRTRADGTVTLDLRPGREGSADVVVTCSSHLPYEGEVRVESPIDALPVADGWQVTGVEVSGSRTEVHVELGVRNAGLAAPTGWELRLASTDPRVRIPAPAGALGPLAAGETGRTSAFVLRLDPELPDGAVIPLVLEASGARPFRAEWQVPVNVPALRLDGFAHVAGEVRPRITNVGSAPTGAIVARLASADGVGVVLDGEARSDPIAPGSTAILAGGFRVAGAAHALFGLELDDGVGGTLRRTVDLVAPPRPLDLRAEPRGDGALLTWSPVAREEAVSWIVRGGDGGEMRIAQGSLARVALPSGASREVTVIAVDASGNESGAARVTAHSLAPSLPGWPQTIASMVGPSPLVAWDVDGDGAREIALGSMWETNAVHLFRADGREWTDGDANPSTNGVFARAGERIHAVPRLADVDADGRVEIFAGSLDGRVYGWRLGAPGAPPELLPGWPVFHAASGVRSTPALGDLDADGELEIVTLAMDGNVRAFELDGTLVEGWPRSTGAGGLGANPVVHDLDGDGRDDVVFGATDSLLYVVAGDGTDLPGWPAKVGAKIQSCPVLFDVDADGRLEIFVLDRDGLLWGFRLHDRDPVPGPDLLPGWPVSTPPSPSAPSSPAVADLDGDGVPEIVVNAGGEVTALHIDGRPLPGWPVSTGALGVNSPVIADLDGDGGLDVLVGTSDLRLTAYRSDGTVLGGWPHLLTEMPKSTPFVADVDGDGDLDVAFGADDRTIRVVDVTGPAIRGAAPWPGFHGPPQQPGIWIPVLSSPLFLPSSPGAGELTLFSPAPNPFRDGTALRFVLQDAALVWIDVFDVSGRRVASPVRGVRHGPGPHAIGWAGHDLRGRDLPAGIYFVRLRADDASRSAKVLRLR